MLHQFKSRLAAGEYLSGTMITRPTPTTTERLAGVGFDRFFIAEEHGPQGTRGFLTALQAVDAMILGNAPKQVLSEVKL